VPIVEISVANGQHQGQIRDLIHAVHDAVVTSLGVAAGSVRVLVREVPTTHWAAGDVTLAERWGAESVHPDGDAAPPDM
jgi:4-oxalocrotonate tautomerase